MSGLQPGALALVVRSALVPENLGREVQVLVCLGEHRQGERLEVGSRFVRVNKPGTLWLVRGVHCPLKGLLMKSHQTIDVWELVAHASSLLPLSDDQGKTAETPAAERLSRSASKLSSSSEEG